MQREGSQGRSVGSTLPALTPQQLEVLDYARELIVAGAPPSARDVSEQLNIPLSAVRSTLDALIEAGALRRGPERAFNLQLAEQGDIHAVPTSILMAELRRRGRSEPAPARPRDDRRHRCAIRTCDTQIAPDKVMCGRHWFALPLDLRRGLKRTSQAGETARFDALLASARSLIETSSPWLNSRPERRA